MKANYRPKLAMIAKMAFLFTSTDNNVCAVFYENGPVQSCNRGIPRSRDLFVLEGKLTHKGIGKRLRIPDKNRQIYRIFNLSHKMMQSIWQLRKQ